MTIASDALVKTRRTLYRNETISFVNDLNFIASHGVELVHAQPQGDNISVDLVGTKENVLDMYRGFYDCEGMIKEIEDSLVPFIG